MRIRKPRGLTTTQLMVATVVGVIGGVYIYRPFILDNQKKGQSLHNDNIEPVKATTSIQQFNRSVSLEPTPTIAK